MNEKDDHYIKETAESLAQILSLKVEQGRIKNLTLHPVYFSVMAIKVFVRAILEQLIEESTDKEGSRKLLKMEMQHLVDMFDSNQPEERVN